MSQSILPGNFSVNGLSVIERRRLEYYYEQYVLRRSWIYGEGHFILACYAAMPVVLTPDLLYKLWLNFKDYLWEDKPAVIHPVAPADLLLSPLVEEIGHELYEMPESIRQVLLLHLKEITSESAPNPQRLYALNEIAQFLHSYAQYDFTPANKNDDAFREAQIWTAMSYLDPGQAFGQLVNKYKQAKDKSPEQLRYANALGNMSRRFMLDIVRDPAMVPQAHKAVTALTSVVKDVFNDRDPARLAEFQREIQASDDEVLTDEPLVKENVINIEIDELVTKRLGGVQKKKGKGKLRALVVGVMGKKGPLYQDLDYINSAELFAALLEEKTINNREECIVNLLAGNDATKQAILNAWQSMIEKADEEDDLLFYLAADAVKNDGHCWVVCADTKDVKELDFLLDEEMGRVANTKRVNSITMIIQTDHAATEYWLDTSRNGNAVLAACKYEQQSMQYKALTREGRSVCAFTFALINALHESKLQITNRGLFVSILKNYTDNLQFANDNISSIRMNHSPVIICNANTLDQFFAQGNNKLVKLQKLLFDAAFYNEKITGEWDSYTARCLNNYIQYFELPSNLSKQRYIEWMLNFRRRPLNHRPIFLFIFSDPDNKLTDIEREHSWIMEIMSKAQLDDQVDIHQLQNPSTEELSAFFKDLIYRDQIQLIYYSGFDKEGNFLLKDGAFTFADFALLLEYQKNVQLFVSNTCRSEYFAEYVSMLGVAQTIGVKGEISDTEGADFGIELFKTIVAGGQLGDVGNLGRPYIARENGFVLYKKDPDAVLPWKFKEGFKKIRVFVSYSPLDKKLVDALKRRIRMMLKDVIVDRMEEFIEVGEKWARRIKENLDRSDIVLVCISESYLASEFCMEELERIHRDGKPAIGIYLYAANSDVIDKFQTLRLKSIYHPEGWYDAVGSMLALSTFISKNNDNAINEEIEKFLNGLGSAFEKILAEKSDPTKFIAQNEFPSLDKEIIGREELLLLIDQQLTPLWPLRLSGMLGMGKTAIAITYCKSTLCTSKYKYVIWADGEEGIIIGIRLALNASPELRNILNGPSDLYSILKELQSVSDKILLVVDSVNDLKELQGLTNNWPSYNSSVYCLVITRSILVSENVKVGPLSLPEAGELYRTYNQKAFEDESFEEIYDYVNSNVLLLELLAKFANSSPQIESTDQLLNYLRSNASAPLFDDPAFADVGLVTNMYKSANLDKDLEDLMRPLSLFPAREFSRQLFYTILGEQQTEKMEALIVSGWVEQREEYYKIPFIVKEIFRTELKPDAENCSLLITSLISVIQDLPSDGQTREERDELLTIAVSVASEMKMIGSLKEQMELAKLQLILGQKLRDNERFAEGIKVVTRAREYFSRINNFELNVDATQLLASLFHTQGDLASSLGLLKTCRDLLKGRMNAEDIQGPHLLQLINVHHSIIVINRERKAFEEALADCNESMNLITQMYPISRSDDPGVTRVLARCFMDMGLVYRDMNNHEEALDHFDESLSIYETAPGMDKTHATIVTLKELIRQSRNAIKKQSAKDVADQKIKDNAIFDLDLEFPRARYSRSDGDNTISLSAGKLQAFIVDRTLVCFATEITKQQRLDVLDLLLLAQLAARGEYPEIEQAMDWHRSFINVLTKIGCTIDAREFSQFAFPGKTFRLENSIMNMMAIGSFKDNLTDFLDKSLAAIKRFNVKRGGYIHSFEKNTHSDNNAAFQVCLVANSDGALELNLGIAMLTSDSPIEKLFGVWSTENTKLHYATLRGTLNEHFYANVRDGISEKLSYSKGMYIVGVKLF